MSQYSWVLSQYLRVLSQYLRVLRRWIHPKYFLFFTILYLGCIHLLNTCKYCDNTRIIVSILASMIFASEDVYSLNTWKYYHNTYQILSQYLQVLLQLSRWLHPLSFSFRDFGWNSKTKHWRSYFCFKNCQWSPM